MYFMRNFKVKISEELRQSFRNLSLEDYYQEAKTTILNNLKAPLTNDANGILFYVIL